MMKSYFEMVREFHETYGLVISEEPMTSKEITDNVELWQLRTNLHTEEFRELGEAMLTGNIVDIADAIGDSIVVLCGTAVSYGIPLDEVFAEIHRSNMSKLGEDGKPIVREDGKILKGPNFSPPDLKSIIYDSKD